MAVIWKAIKFKHVQQAQQMKAAIDDQTIEPVQIIEFFMPLIESWDFIDAETGQAVAAGDYAELTIEQFNELMADFNAKMHGVKDAVKKTSLAKSSYGATKSKPAKQAANSHAIPPTG